MGDEVRAARRVPAGNGWTKVARSRFLAVLTATCDVTAAARAAGKTAQMARALGKRDGDFALAWQEALDAGYERLENALLARALGQVPGDAAADLPPLDPVLAIKVLQLRGDHRRGRHGGMPKTMTQDEIDTMLLARLDALAAQRGAPGA